MHFRDRQDKDWCIHKFGKKLPDADPKFAKLELYYLLTGLGLTLYDCRNAVIKLKIQNQEELTECEKEAFSCTQHFFN
jgi:hypothetical protein